MAEEIIKVKVDLDVAEFSKNAKAMSDALSKILGKEIEIFNGRINKTAKLVENTEKALGGAAIAANKAGNSIKQSNQQWTNFALVIQDLPYGFRGIQNNLPALVGGFASLTGPIYLAVSAVVALFTALDSGLISFGNKIKLSVNYGKEFATNLADQKVKLDSLYRAATSSNRSLEDRVTAAKKLKEEYPKLLENFSAEEIAAGKAKDAYDKLSVAVIKYAKAEAAQSVIKEVVAKQLENESKIAELTLELTAANNNAKKRQAEIDKKNLVYAAGTLNLEAVRASTIQDNIDKLKSQNKELDKTLKTYSNIYDANVTFDLDKGGAGATPKIEDNTIALLKSQQQYYKDNILMFAAYEQEILRREEQLAVRQAQAEGKNAQYIANIRKKFAQDRLNSAKDVSDKLDAIQAKLGEEEGKRLQAELDLVVDGRKKIADALLGINQKFLNDDIDAAKKANEVKLRLDRGWIRRQIADYQAYIDKLKALRAQSIEDGSNVDLSRIDKEIMNSEAAIEALGDTFDATARQISGIVSGMLGDSFALIGEGIGKALGGGKVDIFGSFLEILSGGLIAIGKALIAYGVAMDAFKKAFTNPYAAIAAGVALVAAGSFLKSKISSVSGGGGGGAASYGNVNSNTTTGAFAPKPSFGLLGQSPNNTTGNNMSSIDNAQNMSSNSATFVLRGQDLLLSVNRAQKASNLKGQNINLAG